MNWPGIVKFENSHELEILETQKCWDAFLQTLDTDCKLILSDGAVCRVTVSQGGKPVVAESVETISTDTAIELAREHMSAHGHCCVSKFYAPSVEGVIAALCQLDD